MESPTRNTITDVVDIDVCHDKPAKWQFNILREEASSVIVSLEVDGPFLTVPEF